MKFYGNSVASVEALAPTAGWGLMVTLLSVKPCGPRLLPEMGCSALVLCGIICESVFMWGKLPGDAAQGNNTHSSLGDRASVVFWLLERSLKPGSPLKSSGLGWNPSATSNQLSDLRQQSFVSISVSWSVKWD